MITINLPPELEKRLKEAAQRRGLSPQHLAIESLLERFHTGRAPSPPDAPETLRDFLGEGVGSIEGAGEPFSERCGQRFAEHLAEKQQRERE